MYGLVIHSTGKMPANLIIAQEAGCTVVNLECGHFISACEQFGLNYVFTSTLTNILDETYVKYDSIDRLICESQTNLSNAILASLVQQNVFCTSFYAIAHTKVISQVTLLYERLNICKSHDINHSLKVFNHATKALAHEATLSVKIKFLIELAALLHDVDDAKFTTVHNHVNTYQNAVQIMQSINLCVEDINLVIEMISYVSASVNKNNIPARAVHWPWLLICRHADRLEGCDVIRCYQYTKTIHRPLYTDQTAIPTSTKDVWTYATAARFDAYDGNSVSMIDHYYDKLFAIGKFATRNPYLLFAQQNVLDPLFLVIDTFIKNKLNDAYFESLIEIANQKNRLVVQ